MNQQVAQGSALVAIVPNTIFGFYQYTRRHRLDVRVAALLGGSGIVFTYLAAMLATTSSPGTLRRLFAIFLVATAAFMLWRMSARTEPPEHPLAWGWTSIVGVSGASFRDFSESVAQQSHRPFLPDFLAIASRIARLCARTRRPGFRYRARDLCPRGRRRLARWRCARDRGDCRSSRRRLTRPSAPRDSTEAAFRRTDRRGRRHPRIQTLMAPLPGTLLTYALLPKCPLYEPSLSRIKQSRVSLMGVR
jgi:hypothetical protein